MNNIVYTIIDSVSIDSEQDTSWNEIPLNLSIEENTLKNECRLLSEMANINSGEFTAHQTNYDINYSTKYLTCILKFYGFKKGRLKKKDIILKIVNFEMCEENASIVENRRRLFDNFIELANDPFFSKFIVGRFL